MVTGLVTLLILFRWFFPERPIGYTGPRALLDAGFALALLAVILFLSVGLGRKVERWLKLEDLTFLEQVVFGLPIGLGALAYGVMTLGLIGLLQPWVILLYLVIVGIWAHQEWSEVSTRLPVWVIQLWQAWRRLSLGKKAVCLLGGLILACSVVQALAPPWDYDGLMYHLHGPKLFLQAGRILLLPDTWANYPFTLEMLYTLGMAFGSDTFARLIHLIYGVLLVLATFCLGRRYLGGDEGWIAVVILLGVPILPFWASLAYTDMAGLYEFLAMYALVLWKENQQRRWLVLAGLMMGWALGSRYLAVGGLGVLGLWVIWQCRYQGLRNIFINGIIFGLTAVLLGSPWYIKNWLWSGNPVYPFFFGGLGWTTERLDFFNIYQLNSFGTGRSFLDYILLPWNLFAQHEKFSTLTATIEIPNILFLLVLLYLWMRRGGGLDGLAGLTMLRFIGWALGPQQFRFLLPMLPAFSLLTTSVLFSLTAHQKSRRWRRVLVPGLAGGMMVATLVYQLFLLNNVAPLGVVLGTESKDAFLRRSTYDYSAIQFAQRHLSSEERVLLMWDGQGYYCDKRCLPDIDQTLWTRLVSSKPHATVLATQLHKMKITHLLFSLGDADWFLQHDPTGQNQQAIKFFLDEFQHACTKEIYQDQWTRLFEVTCK
jgi:hypothetical protein